jgi:hypothetical protein
MEGMLLVVPLPLLQVDQLSLLPLYGYPDFFALKASSSATNAGGSTRSMAGYWSCLLSEAAAGSTLRDAGTSLASGDGSLTDATILCCSASTESTGSTVEGGFVGIKAFPFFKSMEGLMRWRKAMWRKKTGSKNRKGKVYAPSPCCLFRRQAKLWVGRLNNKDREH